MRYYAMDIEDVTRLRTDLEPYPAELLENENGIVRIDKHVLVQVETQDAGFIRFILEHVYGYEIADSCDELIYEEVDPGT